MRIRPFGVFLLGAMLCVLRAGGAGPPRPRGVAPAADAGNLNILIRGQSNAGYFETLGGARSLADAVQRRLGFDGKSRHVTLLVEAGKTYWSGTGLVPSPMLHPASVWLGGSAHAGWRDSELAGRFIAYLRALPPDIRSSPTVTVWLHNESDSTSAALTQADWESAVRFSIGEERAALGQSAATTPVDAVYVPFDFETWSLRNSGLSPTVQRLKAGFEHLAADPSLNLRIAAQAGDSDMDGTAGYGGMHFDRADALQLAGRLALTIAHQFAAYARPGSDEADGPGAPVGGLEAVSAEVLDRHRVLVGFSGAGMASRLAPLSPAAALGAGWAIVDGAHVSYAGAASLGRDGVIVSFPDILAAGGQTRLYYGWGTGRLFVQAGPPPRTGHGEEAPGRHAAVYDEDGLPIWVPAGGLLLLGAPGYAKSKERLGE